MPLYPSPWKKALFCCACMFQLFLSSHKLFLYWLALLVFAILLIPWSLTQAIVAELLSCMRDQSPIAKKTWLSIHPRNFGTTIHPLSICSLHRRAYQCEMSHFLAIVWDLILHIHVLWSIDSCQNRVSADQYHMTIFLGLWRLRCHWGYIFFFLVFSWQSY